MPSQLHRKDTAMHQKAQEPYLVTAPVPPRKRTLNILNGGANRGARGNVGAFSEFNLTSERFALVPVYVDPMPGRAAAMKEEAERHGVAAEAVEARVEDVVLQGANDANTPKVLNLDRASAIANVLKQTEARPCPVLGYLLLKLPTGRLWAIRFVLEPKDTVGRRDAIAFFEQLATASERAGSGAILGEQADPSHVLAEPAIRAWFADHTKKNLAKIAAGVEPVSPPMEITTDGTSTLTLIVARRERWSDPVALAEEVLADPAWPIRRGSQFVVAEVTKEGIRFHPIRRRTDDRVTVATAEIMDRASVEAREATEKRVAATALQRAEDRAAAEVALARLTREVLSRRNPVTTTD